MDEGATSSWFSLFSFLGTVLGKALFDEIPIDIQFAPFFLRKLVSGRRTWYPKDLFGLEPLVYKYLIQLKKFTDEQLSALELDFTIDENKKTVNLVKEDGKPWLDEKEKPILVKSNNVLQYVSAFASYRLEKEAQHQTRCFLNSFHQIIPNDWISIFDERELQLLISGLPKDTEVAYLRENCIYRSGYSEDHQVIINFWEVVIGFSKDDQTKFFKFITGLSRVRYLSPENSKSVLEIHRLYDYDDGLPTSATCSNILRLPLYNSKELLESKLLEAIRGTEGFWDGYG